jgi:hypothetical protein
MSKRPSRLHATPGATAKLLTPHHMCFWDKSLLLGLPSQVTWVTCFTMSSAPACAAPLWVLQICKLFPDYSFVYQITEEHGYKCLLSVISFLANSLIPEMVLLCGNRLMGDLKCIPIVSHVHMARAWVQVFKDSMCFMFYDSYSFPISSIIHMCIFKLM